MSRTVGKKRPSRRRVIIEVDAEYFTHVERYMASPEGVAEYGRFTTIRGFMGKVADVWMTMNFDAPGGKDAKGGVQ